MADTLTVNTTDLELIRSRMAVAASFGGSLDVKRPAAWAMYGWPENLTFAQVLSAYERGGAGHGAVHRLLDGCWEGKPRIKQPGADKETPWETKTAKAMAKIKAWAKLRDFDRRNMVGRYSALIYRVRDGMALDQPMVRASELVDLVPVYEDQISVERWHEDPNAENYGQPAMFALNTRRMGKNDQAAPVLQVSVHPSRVQIMAEGSVGDMFDGVPLLKAGFNALVDIEKISGGSAESFLKNSARALTFEYEPGASPSAIGPNGETVSVKQAHEEQVRKLNTNIDSAIVTQGAKAGVLQTAVSDPTGAFQLAANLFAASVRMPFTILFGQQTGRLASDQDKADMHKRCKSRQENELVPMIAEFVTRMQAAGIIESGEFEVEFPDVGAPTDAERLDRLEKMTSAMQKAFQAGAAEPLFDTDELRRTAGFEPRAELAPIAGDGGSTGA